VNVMNLLAQARPASLDPQPDPARRANDLAAAIATARPDQQRPGNRTNPRRSMAWRARPGRRIAAGAGLAALAGAAAAAVALATVGASGAAPGAKTSPEKSGSLRTAILTAFDGVSGDIWYSRVTQSWSHGSSVTDDWFYPLQPSVGQQVRLRTNLVHASDSSRFDNESIYRQPAYRQNAPGIIQTRAEEIDVEYGNRTWSDQMINEGFMWPGTDPAALRKAIASGKYAAVVKTELGGRSVLKLTIESSGQGMAEVTTLWVDAVTYLPLREVEAMQGGGLKEQVDSACLPPTAANLASLNVAIPAGFTRTPTIELPKSDG
jgi:hypothetical protein